MTDGHRGVRSGLALHGKQRGRLAHDEAAAEHHDMFAGERHLGAGKEFHDAGRGAGDETGVVLLREFAQVQRVEAVHILLGGDAAKDGAFVQPFGQRGLHQNAVDAGVRVEPVHQSFQLGLRDRGRWQDQTALDADVRRSRLLFPNIGN